jgi:hypothetical protein
MRIRQAGVPSIDSAAAKCSAAQERPERIAITSDRNPSCAAKRGRESILRSLAAEIVLPLASPGHGGAATPRAANSPPVSSFPSPAYLLVIGLLRIPGRRSSDANLKGFASGTVH